MDEGRCWLRPLLSSYWYELKISVTAKVDSSTPLRPRLNPRATGAKPHWGSAVQPQVQLRAKKQTEAKYVSSYKLAL